MSDIMCPFVKYCSVWQWQWQCFLAPRPSNHNGRLLTEIINLKEVTIIY